MTRQTHAKRERQQAQLQEQGKTDIPSVAESPAEQPAFRPRGPEPHITLTVTDGPSPGALVSIAADGTVTRGPAWTSEDEGARLFLHLISTNTPGWLAVTLANVLRQQLGQLRSTVRAGVKALHPGIGDDQILALQRACYGSLADDIIEQETARALNNQRMAEYQKQQERKRAEANGSKLPSEGVTGTMGESCPGAAGVRNEETKS